MKSSLVVLLLLVACGSEPTPTGTVCPDPDPGTLTYDNFGRDFMTRRVLVAAGNPKAIVDTLEKLHYETGANGGFILGRGFHAMDNIREFVDLVVPELQRRGLSTKKYGGRTLRENLGLPRPPNRFFAARH